MLECVKVATPAILFAGIDLAPPALEQKLARRPGETEQASPPAVPLATVKPGTQLSLIPPVPASPPAPVVQTAADHDALSNPEPSKAAPTRSFALDAPMRLNPVVRDALTAVVHTLNPDAGPAQCCTVASGIFVPLGELERRGVEPSLALRALAEVRMLARVDVKGSPTLTRDFNGTPTVGLVIDPRFVDGVDLEGFAPPTSEGA